MTDDPYLKRLADEVRAGELPPVTNLFHDDLPALTWAGGPAHLRYVADALERQNRGEVEYLAVRDILGRPVSVGGIDYGQHSDAGVLWQLTTHPDLRSLGLGRHLIADAERRIARRGRPWARLGVETSNRRARALYERLGYRFYEQTRATWEEDDGRGGVVVHHADVANLQKRLA